MAHKSDVLKFIESLAGTYALRTDPLPEGFPPDTKAQWKAQAKAGFADMCFPAAWDDDPDKFLELIEAMQTARHMRRGFAVVPRHYRRKTDKLRLALALYPYKKELPQLKKWLNANEAAPQTDEACGKVQCGG